MDAATDQHVRALAEAEAVLREWFAFMRAATRDPSTGPSAEELEQRWSRWSARMREIAGALAAGRRTARIHPSAAGESALVEVLLSFVGECPLSATAGDVRRDLAGDDPVIERWVVGTGAGVRVFECLLDADTRPDRTREYVRSIAERHPHPLVRAHARSAIETDAAAAEGDHPAEVAERAAAIADRVDADFPDAHDQARFALDA